MAPGQGRLKWKALLWERDPPDCLNRALGSQKVEGSSMEEAEESTLPPSMEPTTEEAEQKVRQGVWGDTTTTVLLEAGRGSRCGVYAGKIGSSANQ